MDNNHEIIGTGFESDSKRLIVDHHRTTKPSEPTDLIELAHHVQHSNMTLQSNASIRLRCILDQLNYLKREATKVLFESKRDAELHEAASNLIKKPGHIYHFYKKPDGSKTLSLISPKEWGLNCPFTYLGSYQLNIDLSWTPENDISQRAENDEIARLLLNTSTSNFIGFDIRPLQSIADTKD